METRLVALKLVLEGLGLTGATLTAQRAVYLAQVKVADLCYRFGWYTLGPYSGPLDQDLWLSFGEEVPSETQLRDSVRQGLESLRTTLESPPKGLSRPDWIGLLACLDFLRRVSRLPTRTARQHLEPQWLPFVPTAVKALAHSQRQVTSHETPTSSMA